MNEKAELDTRTPTQLFMEAEEQKIENAHVPAGIKFVYPKEWPVESERGKPILWEVRPMGHEEHQALKEALRTEEKATQKPVLRYTYNEKLIIACAVEPRLTDVRLQNSKGATCEEELLRVLLLPGEIESLAGFITELSRFNVNFSELVKQAKN